MNGTTGLRFLCCDDDRRRNEIGGRTDVNGIDFLEVLDEPGQPDDERQRTLFVHFINDPSGLVLTEANVRVGGGERISGLRVESAQVEQPAGFTEPVLTVVVDRAGDFSTYTLRLVESEGNALEGFDPVLRAVDFSFKVNCETEFDPEEQAECGTEPREEPQPDYLARDYPRLRQLMLDRLALLLPDWSERNPADAGVALVELLAYVGDQLSYRQDAVATEAYLGTCRLRTSARRHARLIDYPMHDGCNARTFVHVEVAEGVAPFELDDAIFFGVVPGLPRRLDPGTTQQREAWRSGAGAFQQVGRARLAPEHNEIRFYTWGARECCLPKGAVRATLRGALPNLEPGMVLVFKEARSSRSGDPDDADLSHRHPVLLTEVTHTTDPLGGRFDLPPTDDPVPVTEIAWAAEDALPFPVCISAEAAEEFGRGFVDDVSVALGNIVLADHGIAPDEDEEDLGVVPADTIRQVVVDRHGEAATNGGGPSAGDESNRCRPDRTVVAPARFRPRLRRGPLTQAVPFDKHRSPASAGATLRVSPADAVPAITLDDETTEPWKPRTDLLSSAEGDKHFVVEVEADGRGRIRFGDGVHGARPVAGRRFTARYRVGNGPDGNVGAEALVHVVSEDPAVLAASNPLPATGGTAMETIDDVRNRAPVAFRPQTVPGRPNEPQGDTLQRAVTPADYAALTETQGDVQRARATFRWTGSWRTMSVTVDPLGGVPVTGAFERTLRTFLERYRLAGHDVEIEPPRPVALEVAMTIRVEPGYFAADVRGELLDVFSSRVLPDGRRGLFHPDNLTFGQTVYLSPLYEVAQAVDGVESVDITTFQRRDRPGTEGIDPGRLELGRLEIARLENDPNFPERGVLSLTLAGGA